MIVVTSPYAPLVVVYEHANATRVSQSLDIRAVPLDEDDVLRLERIAPAP